MSNGRLFLIDGHALVFKMYYAFLRRPMINSKGVDTSILFGFTKYLLELLEKEKPTHIAVAFDPPGGTFRNEMYPPYKANRPPTPQLVIDALEPLMDICRAMNIPVLMMKGYEADDVIGSMAKRSAREGLTVFMVTPDKDYGQLIEDDIIQYKPPKGGESPEIFGPKEICGKYGIQSPLQVIDMLTLCGDAADNVPGVNGVGEVGAAKLISRYSSVENIYEHLDELSARQKAMFEEARGHIGLSKQLVTIKTDIPLDVTRDDMLYTGEWQPRIVQLFAEYEFNSLKRHIKHIQADAPVPAVAPRSEVTVRPGTASEVAQTAFRDGRIALGISSGGVTFAAGGVAVTLPLKEGNDATGDAELDAVLSDPSIAKCGHGLKPLYKSLHIEGPLLDTELMHYLLNPERSHDLETLAGQYLGLDLSPAQAAPASLFDEVSEPQDEGLRVAAVLALAPLLEERMDSDGVRSLYDRIEAPLLPVLARMEAGGVRIDLGSLRGFAEGLRGEIARKEALVRELTGIPTLNVLSPKQIGEALFEKMMLDPKAKKPSKGTWPTDEETLTALRDKSPVIDAILDFRAAKKLLSTYIEPFPSYVSPSDGRVHTTFNQALTSTGRLSSSNPNLQNIPVRTEMGRTIREAFVPEAGDNVILSADYSQIELRIMAHLCGDEHLTRAFLDGVDVHAATASKIFHKEVAEVTPDERRIAKTANFGIMYGISAFGLSQRLKVSRSEAKGIIEDYFASFPTIRSFIDGTLQKARETGYVETLFGRRRYVPDVNSNNATVRALAERNAVNAPIQGTSADIIKLAMIAVDRRIREEGLRARMVLQIHDELVFESPSSEVERLRDMVVREMENVISLSVPLTVECNYGRNWLEAH